MPPTVYIDYSLCFGCGACADLCPENFEMRDEKAWFIKPETFDAGLCVGVVAICAAHAISIEQ